MLIMSSNSYDSLELQHHGFAYSFIAVDTCDMATIHTTNDYAAPPTFTLCSCLNYIQSLPKGGKGGSLYPLLHGQILFPVKIFFKPCNQVHLPPMLHATSSLISRPPSFLL